MIVTLFQGADGWGEGLRTLGLHDEAVGIELDRWATLTARAAGHRPVRADVETYPTDPFTALAGLIASPPCPAFSTAGKGAGRPLVTELADAAAEGRLRPDLPAGVRLTLEPVRWVRELAPRWVAFEQVPAVLPIWHGYEWWLRELGYSTWAGVLNSADYGVPQTRKRAVLVASLDRAVGCPAPTHAEHPGLFGLPPWTSMEEALGWGFPDRPARTVCGARQPRWLYSDADGTHGVVLDRRTRSRDGHGGVYPTPSVAVSRPAPTITGKGAAGQAVWVCGDESRRMETSEALTLQGFRADYPVKGNRTAQGQQVGNAVPPPLAAHACAEATGLTAARAARFEHGQTSAPRRR